MNNPYRTAGLGPDDPVIVEMHSEKDWIRYMRNRFVLILAAIIILVNIGDGDLYRAVIRGVILLVTALIIYFKSDTIFDLSILVYRSGRIVVKKGLSRKIVASDSNSAMQIVKTKRSWLIGQGKVKVPLKAFPNLDKQITEMA